MSGAWITARNRVNGYVFSRPLLSLALPCFLRELGKGETTMNTNRTHDHSDYSPGERVKVTDGTFVGMRGLVLSLREAKSLWEAAGGQQPPLKDTSGTVWVALPIFGRVVPVSLFPFQLAAEGDQ